jgi:GAF domain-containing protein
MERERRILVQPDLSKADPPAPPALIAGYGAKAQMLGPIFRKDHLVGWISVHETTAPREWRASDVDALEEAVKATHRTLDAMG